MICRKIKAENKEWGEISILNRIITEKVTFEKIPKGVEGACFKKNLKENKSRQT